MNFNQKLKRHIQNVEANYLLSSANQKYVFPRNRDMFNYSPERSYSSLDVPLYNLKQPNNLIYHYRGRSLITESIKNLKITLSPSRTSQPQKYYIRKSNDKPTKLKRIGKPIVTMKLSQYTMNISQVPLRTKKLTSTLITEPYENIGKIRLSTQT